MNTLDNSRVWIMRWFLFIFVGYPTQLIVYILYPFAHLYWRLFIYEKIKDQKIPTHEMVSMEDYPIRMRINSKLLDNTDDHGAFTMFGFIKEEGLSLLLMMNNFVRRVDDIGVYNLSKVSGDVVVAWCFAATHEKVRLKNLEWEVRGAAWNYLLNLGTCSFDADNGGWVSNRCNNFGINFCPDSEVLGLGQPMAGPQYYTTSALFALASFFHWKWKVVFWIHWILMGGWYWCWSPVIYSKTKPVHYAKDIVMKSLHVQQFVFGRRWWIIRPMAFITFKISEYRNELFYAICGFHPGYGMSPVMNAFFSQKADASSRLVPNDMNPYLTTAMMDLYKQTRGFK